MEEVLSARDRGDDEEESMVATRLNSAREEVMDARDAQRRAFEERDAARRTLEQEMEAHRRASSEWDAQRRALEEERDATRRTLGDERDVGRFNAAMRELEASRGECARLKTFVEQAEARTREAEGAREALVKKREGSEERERDAVSELARARQRIEDLEEAGRAEGRRFKEEREAGERRLEATEKLLEALRGVFSTVKPLIPKTLKK